MNKLPTLKAAIANRRNERHEKSLQLANEAERIEFDRKYRELVAVSVFRDWLSKEYQFDVDDLSIEASEQGIGTFRVSIRIEDGIVVLLAPFSLQDKKPIAIRTPNIWRAAHSGYACNYRNFLDAASYALYGEAQ